MSGYVWRADVMLTGSQGDLIDLIHGVQSAAGELEPLAVLKNVAEIPEVYFECTCFLFCSLVR